MIGDRAESAVAVFLAVATLAACAGPSPNYLTAYPALNDDGTVNAVIEPSPEGAIGKNYLTYPGIIGIPGDATHTGYVGGYQDVYVKTAQGWRIKKRIHVMPPMIPGEFVFPEEPPATK